MRVIREGAKKKKKTVKTLHASLKGCTVNERFLVDHLLPKLAALKQHFEKSATFLQ